MKTIFSVIIACYNSKHFIDKAIESLERQDFKQFEVIFIDDHSADGTFEYVNEISSKLSFPVTVVRNEINSGPGVSKGRGVSLAQSDYITFLDSDDWYEPMFFSSLYEKMNQTSADIILFDVYRVQDNGNRSLISNSSSFIKYVSHIDYVAVIKGCLQYICFKKDLWTDIEIPPLYNAEDIAVIPVLLSKAQNIVTLPLPLYNHLYRPNSLSNKANPTIYQSFLKSFAYTQAKIVGAEFKDALEFHGIKTVLYGAVLNALRANISLKSIAVFVSQFTDTYPHWSRNKYIATLPFVKRFFLKLVKYRLFGSLFLYANLHRFVLKYLKM